MCSIFIVESLLSTVMFRYFWEHRCEWMLAFCKGCLRIFFFSTKYWECRKSSQGFFLGVTIQGGPEKKPLKKFPEKTSGPEKKPLKNGPAPKKNPWAPKKTPEIFKGFFSGPPWTRCVSRLPNHHVGRYACIQCSIHGCRSRNRFKSVLHTVVRPWFKFGGSL